MPAKARKEVFLPNVVGAYHCWVRCARSGRLLGYDPLSGRDCSHRRKWIQERLNALASIFAINVSAYNVLENHFHVLLRNRPDLVQKWSNEEVAKRWLQLSAKSLGLKQKPTEKAIRALTRHKKRIRQLRARLSSISWFMAMLDESIGRAANAEDALSGSFWSGRFGCNRLDTEAAVLACMIYIELNQIRAAMVETPEESWFSSIRDRIQDLRRESPSLESATSTTLDAAAVATVDTLDEAQVDALAEVTAPTVTNVANATLMSSDATTAGDATVEQANSEQVAAQPAEPKVDRPASGWLAPISTAGDGYEGARAQRRASDDGFFEMSLAEYLEIVDCVGRQWQQNKPGAIPAQLAPILERLQVSPEEWLAMFDAMDRQQRRFDRRAAPATQPVATESGDSLPITAAAQNDPQLATSSAN